MSLGAATTGLAAFSFRRSSPSSWKGCSWGNNYCRWGLSQFHVEWLNLLLLAALQLLDLFKVPNKLQNSGIYKNSMYTRTYNSSPPVKPEMLPGQIFKFKKAGNKSFPQITTEYTWQNVCIFQCALALARIPKLSSQRCNHKTRINRSTKKAFKC